MRALSTLLTIALIFFLSACHDDSLHYNGYIDADMLYLSSDYPGRLAVLEVYRGQPVTKGQKLFQLEQDEFNFSLSKTKLSRKNLLARRSELKNQIAYDKKNYQRITRMRRADAASQNDLERAQMDLLVLQDKLLALDFQIQQTDVDDAQIKWQKARKDGVASKDGIIFDTYFNEGEYLQTGQPVLSLITKEHIKVIFYVPEKALSQIALGQKVHIMTDGSQTPTIGVVSYIAHTAQYTPPIIYSKEERSALVFRVEARIDNPDLSHLHLGQPVSLELLHG